MRIDAKLQDNGLARDLGRSDNETKTKAARVVRSVSFAVEKRVKAEMPVDTGRARASWGHWTPADVVMHGDESTNDAHWVEKDDGLTIEQGSNVPYIIQLNQGTSQKAPAAFIDKAADAGARELTDKLLKEIGDLL